MQTLYTIIALLTFVYCQDVMPQFNSLDQPPLYPPPKFDDRPDNYIEFQKIIDQFQGPYVEGRVGTVYGIQDYSLTDSIINNKELPKYAELSPDQQQQMDEQEQKDLRVINWTIYVLVAAAFVTIIVDQRRHNAQYQTQRKVISYMRPDEQMVECHPDQIEEDDSPAE